MEDFVYLSVLYIVTKKYTLMSSSVELNKFCYSCIMEYYVTK